MELDTRTLIFCSLFVSGLHGALSLFFGYRYPGTRALKQLGIAMLLAVLGLTGIALRQYIPDFASIHVSHTLISTALVLIDRGVRLFNREATRDVLGWSLAALTFVGLAFLYQASPSVSLRIGFVSLLYATLMARIAFRLRLRVPPEAQQAYRFTEGLYWIWASLTFLRALASFSGPPQTDFMQANLLQTLTFPIMMFFVTATTLGFLWMEVYWLHQELRYQATRDSLTGLLNRNTFLTLCEEEAARCERSGDHFSLALFDVDHFKQINDNYGHQIGDAALCQVVDVLRENIRPQDLLARFGGEEFALLLPDTDAGLARKVAEKVRDQLARTLLEKDGQPLRLSISGGIGSYPRNGRSLTTLIAVTDDALYQAKRGGRNRIESAASYSTEATRTLQTR